MFKGRRSPHKKSGAKCLYLPSVLFTSPRTDRKILNSLPELGHLLLILTKSCVHYVLMCQRRFGFGITLCLLCLTITV